jgi:hypothetical protein
MRLCGDLDRRVHRWPREDACCQPLEVCCHLHRGIGLRRRRQHQRPFATQRSISSELMAHALAKAHTDCGTLGVETGLKKRHWFLPGLATRSPQLCRTWLFLTRGIGYLDPIAANYITFSYEIDARHLEIIAAIVDMAA